MSMPFGFGMPDSNDPRQQPGGFDAASLGAMLQQLGAMLQSGGSAGTEQGPVNWPMVADTARKQVVADGDPVVSDAQGRAVDDAVRLADLWLDPAVTFPAASMSPAAWSRSQWLEATMPTWQVVVTPIAEQMVQATTGLGGGQLDAAGLQAQFEQLPESLRSMMPDGIPPEMASMLAPMMGMMQQLGAAAFSMQLGQALGALACDVVSSSDIGIPLTSTAQAALLPRNLEAFGEGLGIEPNDVRLFLALRESAHQRLFAHVPWLRARIVGAVEDYARGMRVDQGRITQAMEGVDLSSPEALQEVLASGVMTPEDSEEQRAAITRLEVLLALVEGWVDDVVDQAIGDRLPSAVALRETMRRRRAAGGPAERTFANLVGMDLRPKLLREAAALFSLVREGQGIEARDGLWAHPDLLPGGDDLADPAGFVERSAIDLHFDDE